MTARRLGSLVGLGARLTRTTDLDALLSETLEGLDRVVDMPHAMILVPEARRLSVLACRGYPGGVGAEIAFGAGVAGLAADRLRPIRINNVGRELGILRRAASRQSSVQATREIQMPGLDGAQSQLAVPVIRRDQLVAVIFAESAERGAFDEAAEQVVTGLAQILAFAMGGEFEGEIQQHAAPPPPAQDQQAPPLAIKRYESDDSVFFDNEYVIKSLPGRILWRLLVEAHGQGRSEFTNKELRVDPSLKLPPIKDNLETRLILLRRRLDERFGFMRILRTGRGRFRFESDRPIAGLTVVPE